jgi:hypothetical protein
VWSAGFTTWQLQRCRATEPGAVRVVIAHEVDLAAVIA